MIARLALAAALLGSAAGATAVLAAAEDDPPPKRTPPAVAAAAATAQPTPEPLKAEDVKLLLQVPDPAGEAPWAVRAFTTPVKPRKLPKRVHASPEARAFSEATRNDCWELGRLQGDRFGWIDGTGTFTPAIPGHHEVPTNCVPTGYVAKHGSLVSSLGTATFPAGGAPQPSRAITWGPVADDVVAIRPAGEPALLPGPEHLVLKVEQGEVRRLTRGVVEHRDGRAERFNSAPGRPNGERPVPGTAVAEVRAPDPSGGEPWAIVVHRGSRGGACFDGPGRLVGTQLGWIEPRLDTFFPSGDFEVACTLPKPTRAYPLRVTTLVSSIPGSDDRGRIERRTLPNRIVFHGRVHPDVVSVTIRTPRDVRTLVPSPEHHLFIAVYDGQFPGGDATATAHLRNGEEVTRSLYVE